MTYRFHKSHRFYKTLILTYGNPYPCWWVWVCLDKGLGSSEIPKGYSCQSLDLGVWWCVQKVFSTTICIYNCFDRFQWNQPHVTIQINLYIKEYPDCCSVTQGRGGSSPEGKKKIILQQYVSIFNLHCKALQLLWFFLRDAKEI